MGKSILHRFIVSSFLAFGFVSSVEGATVAVDFSTEYQRISGFGASTAWAGSISDADAALLWDTTSGAGLSLHRIRIGPDGTSSEKSIAIKAHNYGVKVWGAPWSSNYRVQFGTDAYGNKQYHLDWSHAQDWANSILGFVKEMKNAGAPLYAVSAQNEPEGTGENHYSADSLALWIGSYLGPTLDTTGVKIIAPESMNWCGFSTYKAAIWANANAKKYTDILATHEYGCTPTAYPDIAAAGKEFWETEIYDMGSNVEDPGMTSALRVAGYIHTVLTYVNMNAFHFWWVWPCAAASCGNGALWSQGSNSQPTKRLWMMGNYSRFVRPGFVRIKATETPTTNVKISAYRDSLKTKIVVVAIDSNTTATSQAFSFTGVTPTAVTAYITDSTRNLAAQTTQTISSNTFTYSLPARSVTTLVFDLGTTSMSSSSTEISSSSSLSQGSYSSMATIPGTIQAENYDLGGEGVAYHDEDAGNSGNVYRSDDVDITGDASDGYKVGWTIAGEWLEYTVNVASAGIYQWEARVSMSGDSAAFHMSLDGSDITDAVQVMGTGSWDTYTTLTGTTNTALSAGTHVLRISIDESYCNIDWVSFSKVNTERILQLNINSSNRATYQVFDLRGKRIGVVNVMGNQSLHSTLGKVVPHPGIYIVKRVMARGISVQKVVVGVP